MSWTRKRTLMTIVITVVSTALALLLVMNFVTPEKDLERKIEHRYGVADPQFRREMSVMLGPSILPGNHVVDLQNGEEIFPAMLAAIRSAQKTITFETYIYWSGQIGVELADALAERARAGVAVHVTIDWAGSVELEEALLERMEEAGVEVERYRPLRWYHVHRLNNRTHRKLLVVDREMVSVGSTNFDIRSLRLNDEASLNIYDRSFGERMTEVFERDLARARPYTYAMWQQRPLREKIAEKVLLPIKSQL